MYSTDMNMFFPFYFNPQLHLSLLEFYFFGINGFLRYYFIRYFQEIRKQFYFSETIILSLSLWWNTSVAFLMDTLSRPKIWLTALINVIRYDYFHHTQPHLGSWLKPQRRWFWENLSISNNSYSFDDRHYLQVQKERLQVHTNVHGVLCPSAIGKMHMLETLILKLMAFLLDGCLLDH